SDGFTLLGGLQTDVIGDFWAQRTDAQPHPPSEIDLDSEDALERLYADQTLIATGLPGVQPKLSLTSLSRSLRRNAIVKFAPPEFPLLVENEAYWLRACSRLRLRAVKAKVRIGKRGFHRLEVDRFDREKGGGRLHTEDGCQIMNLHPADKYQVSWHSLIEAASRVCSAPLPAALHWMHLHLVSWLCGNADLHAKNISVVVAGGVIQPSPVYDVVCTLAYPGLAPQMALKSLGKDDGYRLRDFEELAARLGLPRRPVESMIRRSLDLMPDLVKGFRTSVPYDDATHDRIERILLERWQRLSGSIS
ncbi:MAG: HipA domain-containing protein, partial [Fimbriimonadaceae bacterium]|nr:HipA domain-containing protein [Fimbriimonadaceae bacterium]